MAQRRVIAEGEAGEVVEFEETPRERAQRVENSGRKSLTNLAVTRGQEKVLDRARRPGWRWVRRVAAG